ncbi:MAG: hypothetical protein GTO71_09535 [Woeseiaceae bacterium]|nr:hypothetical protein [Woeseiaceae bacterium]NIP21328.1 hypothetical protein [Woeseiaceae bacterium]NIS90295.1 hypothetical protein [Woeseiaceae bacterium]
MTIQDLGAIGDLVGGVAVLVTLVYLAMQIKQNTKIHASLIRQNFYDAQQQQILHAVESPDFNTLINRSWTTDKALSPGEQTQIWRHMQGILIGYQGAFEQYKSGALPKADWDLVKLMLRTFWLVEGKGKDDAWKAMKHGRFFNEDFLAELENLRELALSHRQELDERGLRL